MFFLLECFVHAFQCVIHMLFRMKLAKRANSNEEQEMGDNLHLPDFTRLNPTLPDFARPCSVELHGVRAARKLYDSSLHTDTHVESIHSISR